MVSKKYMEEEGVEKNLCQQLTLHHDKAADL